MKPHETGLTPWDRQPLAASLVALTALQLTTRESLTPSPSPLAFLGLLPKLWESNEPTSESEEGGRKLRPHTNLVST